MPRMILSDLPLTRTVHGVSDYWPCLTSDELDRATIDVISVRVLLACQNKCGVVQPWR